MSVIITFSVFTSAVASPHDLKIIFSSWLHKDLSSSLFCTFYTGNKSHQLFMLRNLCVFGLVEAT